MSLKTWKQEFYPVGASTLARTKGVTPLQLIDHCITKWSGATVANTKKHGVHYYAPYPKIKDKERQVQLTFDSGTCALCQKYDKPTWRSQYQEFSDYRPCRKCPLALVRDGVPCYASGKGHVNLYDTDKGGSPRRMIAGLKKARAFVVSEAS